MAARAKQAGGRFPNEPGHSPAIRNVTATRAAPPDRPADPIATGSEPLATAPAHRNVGRGMLASQQGRAAWDATPGPRVGLLPVASWRGWLDSLVSRSLHS